MSTENGEWDSVFDSWEREVQDTFRFRLLDLLETAYLEPHEEPFLEAQIEANDLTQAEAEELHRRLVDAQPRVPEMYAPSQTLLGRWIRSFCFTK